MKKFSYLFFAIILGVNSNAYFLEEKAQEAAQQALLTPERRAELAKKIQAESAQKAQARAQQRVQETAERRQQEALRAEKEKELAERTKKLQLSLPINLILKDFPATSRDLLIKELASADNLEAIGNTLHQLSNVNRKSRDYLNDPQLINDWLSFAQTYQENIYRNSLKPEEAQSKIKALQEENNLRQFQNKALLLLSTDEALERYIRQTNPEERKKAFIAGFRYIIEPQNMFFHAERKPYVPIMIYLLKTKRINPDVFISEPSDYKIKAYSSNATSAALPIPGETPLLFVLRQPKKNDPYLVKLLLDVGANPTGMEHLNIDAATANINENTLQNLKLLIDKKADVKNKSGNALRNAFASNASESAQVLATLLEHGAPIEPELLLYASERENKEPDLLKLKLDLINFYAEKIKVGK